jgi:hypothetical protein
MNFQPMTLSVSYGNPLGLGVAKNARMLKRLEALRTMIFLTHVRSTYRRWDTKD